MTLAMTRSGASVAPRGRIGFGITRSLSARWQAVLYGKADKFDELLAHQLTTQLDNRTKPEAAFAIPFNLLPCHCVETSEKERQACRRRR